MPPFGRFLTVHDDALQYYVGLGQVYAHGIHERNPRLLLGRREASYQPVQYTRFKAKAPTTVRFTDISHDSSDHGWLHRYIESRDKTGTRIYSRNRLTGQNPRKSHSQPPFCHVFSIPPVLAHPYRCLSSNGDLDLDTGLDVDDDLLDDLGGGSKTTQTS